MQAKRRRLRTHISGAFWCDPSKHYQFSPASISSVMHGTGDRPTCWLDELFEGGIVLPETHGQKRALTMVISGPPGTGKTTLAMELCCRAALESSSDGEEPLEGEPRPLRSWYITSEAHKDWMIQNARSFRWPGVEDNVGEGRHFAVRLVSVADITKGRRDSFWDHMLKFLDRQQAEPQEDAEASPKTKQTETVDASEVIDDIREDIRDVVVIDSLNTLRGDKFDLYRQFMQLASTGPKLIIAMADSSPHAAVSQDWEFAADVVLRLDKRAVSGYLLRSIEVVKARFQSHVWGQHQLKIYEPFTIPPVDDPSRETKLVRAHPYREQGGIFAFPSIHYILSRYKSKSPSESAGDLDSPVPYLKDLLVNGFPKGRCTALIGGRGTHKSHLGYLQVLHGIVSDHLDPKSENLERAIVVSLRDDEGMTRQTMESILAERWQAKPSLLKELETQGKLEITYYPPGFITPEEFFHRMLLSIHRLKAGKRNAHITVLFNSLDQLSSRFPLCAEQRIFIPGVIQMLSAERVTSYFVAAHDRRTKSEYYGLDSMAELIVQLDRRVYRREDYFAFFQRAFPSELPQAEYSKKLQEFPDRIGAVELRIERFAGGQPAGAAGILELVKKPGPLSEICGKQGLILVPYAQEHVSKSNHSRTGALQGPVDAADRGRL